MLLKGLQGQKTVSKTMESVWRNLKEYTSWPTGILSCKQKICTGLARINSLGTYYLRKRIDKLFFLKKFE